MEQHPSEIPSQTDFRLKSHIEDASNFAKFLFKQRSIIGKTPKQIAEAISVGEPPVRQWERGDNFPGEDKLPAIAEAYGVSLEELTKVFEISKKAREKEKGARRTL